MSTGQYTTFVTAGKLSARNITIGGSRACWFNYVDARVVEVIDARSAIVVPRYLRRVSVDIRGVEENSWGEAVMRAVEMSPVVAIGLSSTEGWKTGDVVPFGHLWVVGPRRAVRIGDVERELDEIEPFTMDAFERVTPPR